MLKLYADTFKLNAAELTVQSLKRLKWLTVLSVIGLVCDIYAYACGYEGPLAIMAAVAGVILLVPFGIVMMSRFANRFWARDKYLDEWVGHQVTDYGFAILAAVFFIAAQFSKQTLTFNFETLAVMAMGVVVFMVLVPHIFLLWTVKPVDLDGEIDEAEFEKTSKRNLSIWIFFGVILAMGFVVGYLSANEGNVVYDAGYEFGYWLGSLFKGA